MGALDKIVVRIFLSTPSVRRATRSRPAENPDGETFLSTPSVRRATYLQARVAFPSRHFYPRPPCGGRLNVLHQENRERLISIHALRAEGDLNTFRTNDYGRISIHALRAEGDRAARAAARFAAYFYPRPPCGGRPVQLMSTMHIALFLSTPSVRRATSDGRVGMYVEEISIHALRAEGDAYMLLFSAIHPHFYPRPPCGGRLPPLRGLVTGVDFYPRPPCGGRQQKFTKYCLLLRHKHENSSF